MKQQLLRVAGSALILFLLFRLLPVAEIESVASALSVRVWLLAFAAYFVIHRVGAAKWRLLMNAGRADVGAAEAVRGYASGLFANLFLPTLVGGDVLRAGLVMGAARRRMAVVLGSLADRAIDVASLMLLLAVGVVLARDQLASRYAVVYGAALAGALAVALVAVLFALRVPLARWPRKARRTVGRSLVAVRRIRRHPGTVARAGALSIGIQTAMILLNAGLAASMGVAVPVAAWLVAWPLAKLAALLPISLGGLGVRDLALAGLLAPWGVSMAAGVTVGLAWQTIVFGGGLGAGVIGWAMGRRLRARGAEPAAVPTATRAGRTRA